MSANQKPIVQRVKNLKELALIAQSLGINHIGRTKGQLTTDVTKAIEEDPTKAELAEKALAELHGANTKEVAASAEESSKSESTKGAKEATDKKQEETKEEPVVNKEAEQETATAEDTKEDAAQQAEALKQAMQADEEKESEEAAEAFNNKHGNNSNTSIKPGANDLEITPELQKQITTIASKKASKAERIRELLGLGLSRGQVAKIMDVRYQQVYQVEKQMEERAARESNNAQAEQTATAEAPKVEDKKDEPSEPTPTA